MLLPRLSAGLVQERPNGRWKMEMSLWSVFGPFPGVFVSRERDLSDTHAVELGIGADIYGGGCFSVGSCWAVSANSRFGMGLDFHSIGLTLSLRYSWLGQRIALPLAATNYMSTGVFGVALVLPGVVYGLLKFFYLDPRAREERRKAILAARRESLVVKKRDRARAKQDISLMQSSVGRIIERESALRGGGMIIVDAVYGNLDEYEAYMASSTSKKGNTADIGQGVEKERDAGAPEGVMDADGSSSASSAVSEMEELQRTWINVTIPVQHLVEESKLQVHGSSKAAMLGFYDPCPGEPKGLKVVYRFRNKLHQITVADDEPLSAPKKGHIINPRR